MTIEQLKSGSWRIKQMYNHKLYYVTVPYKPTKKEATILLAQKMESSVAKSEPITFRVAASKYIESKSNVLSPRTIREYKLLIDRIPTWYSEKRLTDMCVDDLQNCVNEISSGKSPKTVRCYYGFIRTVLSVYAKNIPLEASLPQKEKNDIYVPSDSDVQQILKYTKENAIMFYVPICLACYGLRRSEIIALTIDDLNENNLLTVNKALVENEKNEWIVKKPKTTLSERSIYIDNDVADMIRQQGYIYKGSPQSISNYLKRTQDKLGIPNFSLHKLRHYFASRMMDFADMKTIQELGGWSGNETLSRVYQHSLKMREEEKKKELSNQLSNVFLKN